MRTVCIVQARMGNTRLPGKNGMMICDKPQIWHVLNRLKKVRLFDDIMMAIPHESNNGVLLEAAWDLGIETLDYRGHPADLVRRYAIAAEITGASTVVRVPGDNTFIDATEITRILQHYWNTAAAWNWLTTNLDRDVLGNGYPAGLGAEVYDAQFLHWLDRNVTDARQREHPHRWAFENQKVRTIQAPDDIRRPDLDFSVNTFAEFQWTKDIYEMLYPSNPHFTVRDVLKLLGV
jgi:spore coat polysaccharide biosynthesis protein SpsF